MLKRRSESTDITPLVNSAVEKLQELGTDCKIALISAAILLLVCDKQIVFVLNNSSTVS